MNVFDLLAKISLDTTEYEHGLDFIKNGASAIAGLGAKAIAAATTAVTGFATASVKTGMNFDSAMSQVAATMGKTTDQMMSETASVELSWGTFTGNLRDYAQEMGANTVFSATQAAEALNYMALAGYSTEKSMKTLPSVMNLASAGAMDLASASDMVTDTETALGLESERTTKLIDEMAKTASTTNTSVSQLGSAILTIGGTAKQLNGGMWDLADGTQLAYDGTTELSVALGILADNGTKGSEAGTTLRNVLSSISGGKFAKTFGELGVKAYDSEGKMRSLKDILADMNKVMDGMTDQEKTNLINSTFNARDLKNVNALLATTDDRWKELVQGLDESGEAGVMFAGKLYTMEEAQQKFGDAIYDTEQGFKVLGAAEMMAFQQMDNLSGDITLFQSALEGAQIAISDKVTPSLREFVQVGSEGLGEFTTLLKSGDIDGAIKSIGNTLGQLVSEALSKVPDLVSAGATLLQGLAEGMVEAAGTAFGDIDFGEVIETIVLPMLVGISGKIRESSGEFVDAALSIIDGIGMGMVENSGALLTPILTILTNVIGTITDNAQVLFDAGLALLTKVGEGLVTAIPSFLAYVLPIITQFTETLRENAGNLVDVGLDFILNLAQGIMNSLPTLIEQIPQIVINIAGVINDNAPKVLKAGFDLLVTVGKGIIEAIPTLIENIPLIFEAIVAVWSAINWMSLGRNVINWIKNGFNALRNNIPNTLKSIGQSAVDFFKGIDWANLGSTAIDLIAGALNAAFTTIPGVLLDIASDAWDAFVNVDWYDVGSRVIEGIANGISAGIGWIKDKAAEAARAALDKAKDILGIKSPSRVFRDEVGLMIGRGMALGIDDSESYVDKAISALNTELNDGIGAINMPAIEMAPTAYIKGKNAMSDGKVVYITNNITVDGAESPESYAHRLVQELELEMRTA